MRGSTLLDSADYSFELKVFLDPCERQRGNLLIAVFQNCLQLPNLRAEFPHWSSW